jgi:hypothetical protein
LPPIRASRASPARCPKVVVRLEAVQVEDHQDQRLGRGHGVHPLHQVGRQLAAVAQPSQRVGDGQLQALLGLDDPVGAVALEDQQERAEREHHQHRRMVVTGAQGQQQPQGRDAGVDQPDLRGHAQLDLRGDPECRGLTQS